MARNLHKTKHDNPFIAWIAIGVLLAAVLGLFATYVLRPGHPADDAPTAAAIEDMDQAQSNADARCEEVRSATSLLN